MSSKDCMNGSANDLDTNSLEHYGKKFRSGRYPWGSGQNAYQHSGDFISRCEELHAKGLSDKEIAEHMSKGLDEPLSTSDLRIYRAIANDSRRMTRIASAKTMKEDGLTNSEIAKRLGLPNESSVRSILNTESEQNTFKAQDTANVLREIVNKKGCIDIGAGAEIELGVTKDKLKQASYILQGEGYNVYGLGQPQITNRNQQSNMTILAPGNMTFHDVFVARDKGEINTVGDYAHSDDGGKTFRKPKYPEPLSSKRVMVRYAEDKDPNGHYGIESDGTIELRRGVDDISLGKSNYAQVRILVDGTHYMKGMAHYSDDMPEGVDVVFNTNKHKGTLMLGYDEKGSPNSDGVFKKIKDDPEDPFGAVIKPGGQTPYKGKDGDEHISFVNKIKEEGDWNSYNNSEISAQFLSKQDNELVKRQLKYSFEDRKAQYDEINSLTNKTVKRKMLNDFAEECDSTAAHLEASALPRQKWHVILPVPTLKDNEIYAPNYNNGEQLALVRYPHEGTFQIPTVTVNNKQKQAQKMIGLASDAVGISYKVAEKLSGADFDGDTVICIPTNTSRVHIKSDKTLDGLIGYDAKDAYPERKGMKYMTKSHTQIEMGKASNLITDMTIKGATPEELTRAVKYSMCVIDAEKHKLDYKRAFSENNISELKERYQGHTAPDGHHSVGANTLISRAKHKVDVPKTRGSWHTDPNTGEKIWKDSGESFVDPKTGKIRMRTKKVPEMETVKDANQLISGIHTPVEDAYANYANQMKSLANTARLSVLHTGRTQYSASAAQTYAPEVASLKASLNIALKNAPKERKAQNLANAKLKAITQDNEDISKKDEKKLRDRLIKEARAEVGADGKGTRIHISDKEWVAIQEGAVHDSTVEVILTKSDPDRVRELATPKTTGSLSVGQVSKIRAMASHDSGKQSIWTNKEIADACGCSVSTVNKYLSEMRNGG